MNNCASQSVRRGLLIGLAWALMLCKLVPLQAQTIDFDQQIAPILVSHCLECHRGPTPQGGLALTEGALAQQGGDSGEAIKAGRAAESLLWERVMADEMPPKHPLSHAQKATLKQWIDEGANWGKRAVDMFSITTDNRAGRDWWSLQPLREVSAPALDSKWGRNAIDGFVMRRMRDAGLSPSPEADPRNLIRRLYFDLTGLPPSPEQVAAFVAEPADASYVKIVDELLTSRHYGERWGRHWLDVVRFGESDGFERNLQRENAWHYRDWIISALNDEMPYDEFVRMQLIGDQLIGGRDGAAATGFWVAGVHNTVVGGSERMKQLAREDEIEDVLGTLGQTFLGLTFNCARCHDHKFDPITQSEYYQLAAAISGLGYGEREVPQYEQRAALNNRISELAKTRDDLDFEAKQKIYTLTPGGGKTIPVLLRGDPENVGEIVSPAATRAISGLSADFELPPDAPESERRQKLAQWITSQENPLFARVIVNRVWHYHFGVGIVDTPNDFGFNGGRPSHPELLEFLAQEFRRGGYRLKPLHRLIVTSSTYRQASFGQAEAAWKTGSDVDASNRLLWRGNRRRLEAEAVRDAVLSVAGQLNQVMGGPGFKDVSVTLNNGTTYYEPLDVDAPEFFRRTVYRFNPRGGRSGLLDTFDCPDPAATAPRRSVTTTPLQSLSLMNNALVLRMADYFAQRVREEAGDDRMAQITRAWQLAIARGPTESERELSDRLVTEHGLPSLCRGLFNINEFVVLD